MLINYVKTFVRSLLRFKVYSIINIFGLTLGITTALFIALWVKDELQFDRGHPDVDRIYQVMNNRINNDGQIETAFATQGLIAGELIRNYPEVETAARVDWPRYLLLRNGDKAIMQMVLWADPQVMQLFSVKVLEGNASNPVPDNNSIILTKRIADLYFPGVSAVGKIFRLDEKYDLQVSAVVENTHPNGNFDFDVIAPFSLLVKAKPWAESWNSEECFTYVKFRGSVDIDTLNARLKNIVKEHCSDCTNEVFFYPFGDLHLYGNFVNGKVDGGRIAYVKVVSFIGFFIILIACINFMNLATARSASRGREIGVRKVVGAARSSLALQFIGEAAMMALMSTAVAIAATELLLPYFNSLTSKQIILELTPAFFGGVVLFGCTVGLLAGCYPALYLSAIKAASVLKGQNHFGGARLRQALVVFQFSLAVVMIVCSVIVYQQLDYIKSTNFGYDRENVIGFALRDGVKKNKEAFKNEVLKEPGIKSLTFAGNDPFKVSWYNTNIQWPGKPAGEVIKFRLIAADKDFVSTLRMTVIEGRDFVDTKADSMSYLINEKAAQVMSLKDPVGTSLIVDDEPENAGRIIGVIKDWNNQDLRSDIEPVIVLCYDRLAFNGFAKIEAARTDQAIAALKSAQKNVEPNYPFDYYFLDEKFEREYRSENSLQNLAIVFTLIAVSISCLGLFGLASFMAERRTKELGIRKVLGANLSQLVVMLCSDFTRLVLISLMIGAPIAWTIMDNFLAGYKFHTNISWRVFAMTSAMLLGVAIVTVAWRSLKAAMANPVDSLRSE